MRFICDHDYHIHSGLSLCSDDPKQTPKAILDFSKANGFKKICLTDHYWDESVPKAGSVEFYDVQNTAHIEKALPLPQDDEVEYHFGAEVDMDKNYTIGIGDKMLENSISSSFRPPICILSALPSTKKTPLLNAVPSSLSNASKSFLTPIAVP